MIHSLLVAATVPRESWEGGEVGGVFVRGEGRKGVILELEGERGKGVYKGRVRDGVIGKKDNMPGAGR